MINVFYVYCILFFPLGNPVWAHTISALKVSWGKAFQRLDSFYLKDLGGLHIDLKCESSEGIQEGEYYSYYVVPADDADPASPTVARLPEQLKRYIKTGHVCSVGIDSFVVEINNVAASIRYVLTVPTSEYQGRRPPSVGQKVSGSTLRVQGTVQQTTTNTNHATLSNSLMFFLLVSQAVM